MSEQLEILLQAQKAAQLKQGSPGLAERKQRLQKAIDLLVDNQQALCEAVNRDFGNRPEHYTLMSDIVSTIGHLKHAQKKLKKWMKPERRPAPFPMGLLGGRALLRYQPKGVVGIMSPWNYPINLAFGPLGDVLAAGNRAMIKPSEFTPETSQLMADLVAKYFDPDEVTVVTGGAEVGAAFSALPFDHLIFTGATSIGRKVMQAAAQNLTPVTLELGGKSPVIVGSSADLNDTALKIVYGKTQNSGQICVSPDYLFIEEARLESFIEECRTVFAGYYPTVTDNPDYGAIINQRNYARLKSYIDEAEAAGVRIIPMTEESISEESQKLPLHLLINPGEELSVMQEEIFGPLLIVKTYSNVAQCTDYINARPNPLALYYFGKDKTEQEQVLNSTLSGGVTLNDVVMHVGCQDIPFGGVGESGMGHYHGLEGFKTFSHARGMYKSGFANPNKVLGFLPPYSDKMKKLLTGQVKK